MGRGRPTSEASAAGDTDLDLVAADRVLRPVRRVLGGLRDEEGEVTAARRAGLVRLLDLARAVALPDPLRASLDEARAAVAEEADMATAWALVARIDATLGLPLPRRVHQLPRVRRTVVPPEPAAAQADKDSALAAKPDEAPPARRRARTAASWPPLRLGTPLAKLPLGKEAVAALDAHGIATVVDVLGRPPVTVHEIDQVQGAGRELGDGWVAVGGRVGARATRLRPDGSRVSEVALVGAERVVVGWRWPLTPRALGQLSPDARVVVAAHADDGVLTRGRVVAAAHGRATVLEHDLGEATAAYEEIAEVLVGRLRTLDEPLPEALIDAVDATELADALGRLRVHGPTDEAARARMVLDEALLVQLQRSWGRFQGQRERAPASGVLHGQLAVMTRDEQRGPMSAEASSALEDVKRDLLGRTPMRRVVCGGSPSDVDDVVLGAIVQVAESRGQVLVWSTEAAAAQLRHELWGPLLRGFGHVPMLLSGSPRASDADAIKRGEAHVVFASPGVEVDGLDFRRLSLVVVWEQGAHGRLLKPWVQRKGSPVDLLVACRTPLTAEVLGGPYGDLDVSNLPHHEVPASGSIARASEREAAYGALGAAVRAGTPAIVAFPLTRQGVDLLDLSESRSLLSTLSSQVFDGAEVGLYHGALPASERQRAWADFLERRVPVLVTTTMLELSRPAPRGVVAMVDHADHVDVERLVALRRLVTSAGSLHYVVDDEVDPGRLAVLTRLAEGASDTDVVAAAGLSIDTETPVLGWTPTWLDEASDLDLMLILRRQLHEALAADATLRSGAWASVLEHAHTLWSMRSSAEPPWPAPRAPAAAPRRRRRRRKRR